MSSNTNPLEWDNAVSLWDADVELLLSAVYQQNSNVGQYVHAAHKYVSTTKVFRTHEDSMAAKALVAEFNKETTTSTSPNIHPTLTDVESSTLFRLGIFDCDDAFKYIPGFEQRWANWKEQLQALLNNCSQLAIINVPHQYNENDTSGY